MASCGKSPCPSPDSCGVTHARESEDVVSECKALQTFELFEQ